jgi:tetratricopeptide (TPR) repeat protein
MTSKRALTLSCALVGVALCSPGWTQDAVSESSRTPSADSQDQLHRALELLQQGQFAEAEKLAHQLLESPEPTPHAWLVLASSYQDRRLYEAASEAYDQYLEESDGNELTPFVREQIRQCREGRRSGLKYDDLPSEALTAEELEQLAVIDEKVHTETSEQFVVRARNSKLAKLVVHQAQQALKRVCQEVLSGQPFHKSVDVYVWKDRKDYLANACDAPDWSGGSFSLETKRGRVTSRRIDLTQRDADGRFNVTTIDRILPHELCHLVIDDLFAQRDCPLMLNEGLAMLAEYQLDNDRILLAGTVLAGTERISLEQLLATQWADLENPAAFYAEAFSFTEFVYSRLSRSQFRDFLEHVRKGETVHVALQRCLAVPAEKDFPKRLSQAWESYAIAQSQYLRALNAHLYSSNKRLD